MQITTTLKVVPPNYFRMKGPDGVERAWQLVSGVVRNGEDVCSVTAVSLDDPGFEWDENGDAH